jgi:ubiquinone/menaquinone biosynthesis C-methylase UbiE
MEDKWDDSEFVRKWDVTANEGNPSRSEHVSLIVSLLRHNSGSGERVLDIGIGSAQIEAEFFHEWSDVEFVGIDYSEAMLALARSRLDALRISGSQCALIQADILDASTLNFADASYKNVLSVQTLHHLPFEKQRAIYRQVYRLLQPGGWFILADRVAIGQQELGGVHEVMWDWLEMRAPVKSGWSGHQFITRFDGKDEQPMRLEDQLTSLREAGFMAACIHLVLNRGVFVGVKAERRG